MRPAWMMGTLGLLVMALAACGSDGSDGTTGTGGSGGSTASGGSGAGTGGESWQLVGSCLYNDLCTTWECDANAGAVCDNMNAGSGAGCEQVGGTWTAGAACTKDKSIGTCTEAVTGSSKNSTTSYEGDPLTAADYEEMCTSKQGTWVVP